jgi:DNA modification methylase
MWSLIAIGDARKVLDDVPLDYIDLMVTSPPYFALKTYSEHPNEISMGSIQAYLDDLEVIFGKCFRVLKDGCFACVVVGQYTSKERAYFIPGEVSRLMEKIGFNYRREHIWLKPKGTQGIWNRGTTAFLKKPFPRNTMINIHHEHVLVFQKGNVKRINENDRLTEQEVKEYSWSIWEIPVSMTKDHPAPFPYAIPERLIKMYSYKNEVVLDPFLGSGTTCKAALDLGRDCIGIDVNQGYLPLIRKEIGIAQNRLVSPVDFRVVHYDKGEKIVLPYDEKLLSKEDCLV